MFLLILSGCNLTTSTETTTLNEETTLQTYQERSYAEFEALHITDTNLQLSQEEEIYYIYYYAQQCGGCLAIKNEVLSKIELLEDDKVYLVDVVDGSDIQETIDVLYTPSLVQVIEGEAVNIFVGGTNILNVINGLS